MDDGHIYFTTPVCKAFVLLEFQLRRSSPRSPRLVQFHRDGVDLPHISSMAKDLHSVEGYFGRELPNVEFVLQVHGGASRGSLCLDVLAPTLPWLLRWMTAPMWTRQSWTRREDIGRSRRR